MRRSCWETWPTSRPRPLRYFLKGSNKAPDELRRPLMPTAVVRNSLEKDLDADMWVDTDVDKDEVLVVSERTVVLNSAEGNVFP